MICMGYVYILRCRDGSFYVGSTKNLERRIKEHQLGRGGRYTKGRLPVELVYYEEVPDHLMRKREYELKRLPRKKKLELVKKFGGDSCEY